MKEISVNLAGICKDSSKVTYEIIRFIIRGSLKVPREDNSKNSPESILKRILLNIEDSLQYFLKDSRKKSLDDSQKISPKDSTMDSSKDAPNGIPKDSVEDSL